MLDRTLDTLAGLGEVQRVIQARELTSGQSRLEAIRHALAGAPPSERVLVCDPDHPLLTMGMIAHFLGSTRDDAAATLVAPAADTYKLTRQGRVIQTLDRASLAELRGLSSFARQSLEQALASSQATHELEAVLEAGVAIRLIQADPSNFAVRTPEDCQVAELLLTR